MQFFVLKNWANSAISHYLLYALQVSYIHNYYIIYHFNSYCLIIIIIVNYYLIIFTARFVSQGTEVQPPGPNSTNVGMRKQPLWPAHSHQPGISESGSRNPLDSAMPNGDARGTGKLGWAGLTPKQSNCGCKHLCLFSVEGLAGFCRENGTSPQA